MTVATDLMAQIMILLFGVATVAFTAALVKAVRNYRKTRGISNYWLMFAVAVALGGVLSAVETLRFIGVSPIILGTLDRWIALMFIFALIYTAIETLTTQIDVTIK